ncbi:MAG: Gp138 family membrane-puncturing spike protein [Acidobacteriota bacterium]
MNDLDNEFDVSLGDVLEVHSDNLQEELHTAIPARVESYNASDQTCDAQPVVRRAVPAADGSIVRTPFPIIRAVPVAWPRAGSWYLHMPLEAGDTVLLVFAERDFAKWRQTGEEADPLDVRLNHMSHAIAIPGLYPRTRELGDTPSDALVIGRDGGPTVRITAAGEVLIGGVGASKGVARQGDSVQVTIPTASIGGTEALPTAPVVVTGTITSASATVKAVD